MTVRDGDTVDSITRSADGTAVTLLMIEDRAFDGSRQQVEQVVAKVNTYLRFIQTGQIHRELPDTLGRELRVRLVCQQAPEDELMVTALRSAGGMFARHSVDFGVDVLPPELVNGAG
ncbi:DUF6572 domain-containing protein [Actinocatenispora rupis]|uniref:Uncharacterized protein n=1 Tax=Actinocatenispora rupis TaxID=519421 RepID=A0A8J3NH88_9ACTN|nr:DUF6572 domain-containing protein [Actinocatenispora rupis]GID15704.1 hypothetical protein Aru02nite_65930 [Actinocatenispora rupis]